MPPPPVLRDASTARRPASADGCAGRPLSASTNPPGDERQASGRPSYCTSSSLSRRPSTNGVAGSVRTSPALKEARGGRPPSAPPPPRRARRPASELCGWHRLHRYPPPRLRRRLRGPSARQRRRTRVELGAWGIRRFPMRGERERQQAGGRASPLGSTSRWQAEFLRGSAKDAQGSGAFPPPSSCGDLNASSFSKPCWRRRWRVAEVRGGPPAAALASVDGTLLEAWASLKSYRPDEQALNAGGRWAQRGGGLPPASRTDAEARLYRRDRSRKLRYLAASARTVDARHPLQMHLPLRRARR